MRSLYIDAWGLVFLLCLALLALYGLVQGYRVWRSPDRWKALGLHWYAGLGKLFVPEEQRQKVDEIWKNEQGIRALAVLTMILSMAGLAILIVGIISLYAN
jgi:hypothetical protein